LLEAFQEIILTILVEPHQIRRHVTALSPLATGVGLVRLGFYYLYETCYMKLGADSSESL
jgi:hypothetical protein